MTTDTKTGKTTDTTDKYTPSAIEGKWYEHWLSEGFFHSEPNDKEPYTVVIPPPNVTGILHMGHILNNTIQDVLVRRARMQGKNACWVPGTDHASIATEAKVVARLREKGIEKNSLTREEFLRHAWEWTEEHGGIILKQLRRLGASCDWERTAFTMDEARSESVLRVFVDLYNKGRIYRGVRMVHWDPAAQTALSDEEVVYKEMQGKLYYLRYKVVGSDDFVVVATTRPETILGDTGLCVNPNDERYTLLHGKRVVVPLVGREVPVIADDYVDMEFGTGALKVTPAHDVNDYMLGEKFGLEAIDIFTDDGRIRPGLMYEGMDRFELRKVIEGDLASASLLEKVEPYTNNVGCSERTGVPIEPKLSMQWWLRMEELAKPALDAVLDGDVRFHPDKFRNTYRHWMENIKDWCISRQLWWGHRIPAWFLPGGGFVVALTEEEALSQARLQNPALVLSDLKQSDDVLDTWFSSWLWPISVFDGIRKPDNEDINYYYPTNDLVTAPEIIFFWVARMVMTGYEYRNAKPFSNVYFTGIVRDKQGRKMSKQLGNSPDPLDLIAQYGADGVRMGMMLSTSAGNDVMFDESMCEQGRNFGNKIWNAWRLVSSWMVSDASEQPVSARLALEWFEVCLSRTVVEMERSFASYHISEALMTAYKLFWDDFSAWLLEMVKPGFGQPIDRATFDAVRSIFERLLQILHPFMPFITEEIWHSVRPRAARESIMVSLAPVAGEFDSAVLDEFDRFAETVASVRAIRQKNGIAFREQLVLRVVPDENYSARFEPLLMKMGGLSSVEHVAEIPSPSATFIVKTTLFGVPLAAADSAEQLESLRRDLKYQEGFLRSVEGKLGNERFVAGAPEAVVANERAKQADALAKIAALKEQIALLL